MDLSELFEKAIAESKTLPERPANDVLLQLYAFYKQSTTGDVNIDAPENPFDIVAKAKYSTWESMKGISKETAMQHYIDLVTKLKAEA